MKLNKTDSETYIAIVKTGNMDTMFDFAYQCGRVDVLKELQHDQQKLLDGFSHPKDCEGCDKLKAISNDK